MKGQKNTILFLSLTILLAVLFVADIVLGSVSIPLSEIWAAFTGGECDPSSKYIALNFRLPKAVTAVLAGMSLSCVGLQMQTLFRNPLAGPYVLGVSSGASLGVSIFLLGLPLLGVELGPEARNFGVVGAAWLGAALIMSIVMAVSARIKDIMVILILGMMFGSAATAIVEVLQYLSPESALKSYVVWTMGSLSSVSVAQLWVLVPVTAAGLILSLLLIKPLNMLLLGDNYASTMGLNIKLTHQLLSLATVLLAGTVTAYCGPIGFIGLAIPHVARMLFREADHRILLPATMLTGAVVMLACDIISQLPTTGYTLPINTITALIGIPIIIAVIIRNRKPII